MMKLLWSQDLVNLLKDVYEEENSESFENFDDE